MVIALIDLYLVELVNQLWEENWRSELVVQEESSKVDSIKKTSYFLKQVSQGVYLPYKNVCRFIENNLLVVEIAFTWALIDVSCLVSPGSHLIVVVIHSLSKKTNIIIVKLNVVLSEV